MRVILALAFLAALTHAQVQITELTTSSIAWSTSSDPLLYDLTFQVDITTTGGSLDQVTNGEMTGTVLLETSFFGLQDQTSWSLVIDPEQENDKCSFTATPNRFLCQFQVWRYLPVFQFQGEVERSYSVSVFPEFTAVGDARSSIEKVVSEVPLGSLDYSPPIEGSGTVESRPTYVEGTGWTVDFSWEVSVVDAPLISVRASLIPIDREGIAIGIADSSSIEIISYDNGCAGYWEGGEEDLPCIDGSPQPAGVAPTEETPVKMSGSGVFNPDETVSDGRYILELIFRNAGGQTHVWVDDRETTKLSRTPFPVTLVVTLGVIAAVFVVGGAIWYYRLPDVEIGLRQRRVVPEEGEIFTSKDIAQTGGV